MQSSLKPSLPIVAMLFASACAGAPEHAEPGGARAKLATEQSTLEEDFKYPGAEAYAAQGITLKSGDGNLLIVDCDDPDTVLKVENFNHTFCFKVRGPTAYLTLEVREVYLAFSSIAGLSAEVVVNGQPTIVPLENGPATPLVQGTVYPTLVKLRLST